MRHWRRIFLAGLVLLAASAAFGSQLRIQGLGWWENRRLYQQMLVLQGVEDGLPDRFDGVFIEDAAFLMFERLRERGYPQPTVRATVETTGGQRQFVWDGLYSIRVPVDLTASAVKFELEPGLLQFFESVEVSGVDLFPQRKLERFFIPSGALFVSKSDRAFTPANFQTRIGRLQRALEAAGYLDARVSAAEWTADELSGAVRASVCFEQGPLHWVEETLVEDPDGRIDLAALRAVLPDGIAAVPLTRAWLQDLRQATLNQLFQMGYADARVTIAVEPLGPAASGRLPQRVTLQVQPGPIVTLTGVRFDKIDFLAESTMRRQSRLRVGQPLDILEAGAARRRLMGLGVFDTVDFDFDPPGGPGRELVFYGEKGQLQALEASIGWGSYEMVRGGVRWQHRNPWRRAHSYELQAMVSLKARRAQLQYAIPQIFGTLANAHARLQYGYREEPTHDWQEDQLAVGTSISLGRSGVILAVEYQIEQLDVDRQAGRQFEAVEDATVASFIVRVLQDRRDNPLYPSSGYAWSASLKTAAKAIGGEVNYQKAEFKATCHRELGETMVLHSSLRLGSLYSWELKAENLPFAERFFLGGESTLRSFREGGASPRAPNGERIGAQAYVLANLEWEQRLSGSISAVVFADGAWQSADSSLSVAANGWYALGLGLRLRTPVGPLRLEYARNLNRRPLDPGGAWHFSVGFPF